MIYKKSYSVTSLIDLLNKPALLKWSNKIGLDGINLKDYKKESSAKGTSKHKKIENYIINGIEFSDSNKLDNCLRGYEIYSCEEKLSNNYIHGRSDLILIKDGEKIVCDFKAGKNIYLSTKLQLSTYKKLSNADSIAFINTDNYELIKLNIDDLKYFEIVRSLYKVKCLLDDLKERL